MEFKSKFETEDIVYLYCNQEEFIFKNTQKLPASGMFILEGQVEHITVDYYQNSKPYVTYRVRIGSNVSITVHEDFLAISIDDLAEQSKNYLLSAVSRRL